jgi:hypothetical protein
MATKAKDEKGLLLGSTNAKVTYVSPMLNTADSWFYEEDKGLSLVTELRNPEGDWIGTATTFVTWAQIRRALARKDGPA